MNERYSSAAGSACAEVAHREKHTEKPQDRIQANPPIRRIGPATHQRHRRGIAVDQENTSRRAGRGWVTFLEASGQPSTPLFRFSL
jgi:hypothetical protein